MISASPFFAVAPCADAVVPDTVAVVAVAGPVALAGACSGVGLFSIGPGAVGADTITVAAVAVTTYCSRNPCCCSNPAIILFVCNFRIFTLSYSSAAA